MANKHVLFQCINVRVMQKTVKNDRVQIEIKAQKVVKSAELTSLLKRRWSAEKLQPDEPMKSPVLINIGSGLPLSLKKTPPWNQDPKIRSVWHRSVTSLLILDDSGIFQTINNMTNIQHKAHLYKLGNMFYNRDYYQSYVIYNRLFFHEVYFWGITTLLY